MASFDVTDLDDSRGAVADVANVVSNLLTASVNQFAARNDTARTSAIAQERAENRSSALANLVDSLASTMAASLVPGEAEATLATTTFAMAVKADLPSNLEGQELAGGAVRVPIGALGGGTSSVAAKVTMWADAGPLFYAKYWSPAGFNSSKLRSPLLTVAFEDGGTELVVANLTGDPFMVMPDHSWIVVLVSPPLDHHSVCVENHIWLNCIAIC